VDRERLEEIGEKLGIPASEIKEIKKQGFADWLYWSVRNTTVHVLALLSGIQGLSLAIFYGYMDDKQAYPGTYEPPGGWLLPIFAFGAAAGGAGATGAAYVEFKADKAKRRKQQALILGAVLLSFFAFSGTYCCGIIPTAGVTYMYGVYSRKDQRRARREG